MPFPALLFVDPTACLETAAGFFFLPQIRLAMEPRSRSWALGLGIISLFGLLFSAGFVQQVAADDVADYGTVIGIVSSSATVIPR